MHSCLWMQLCTKDPTHAFVHCCRKEGGERGEKGREGEGCVFCIEHRACAPHKTQTATRNARRAVT
jgi:hypothetical protein